MRAVGIVCEYNPFHLGHLYQIEESRRRLGDETPIVCVMSGDFVQRGEAAIFTKFARAEAACRCGADLVLELPLPWCLSSAEGFASGAVAILSALGCSHLGFGSEGGDLTRLQRLADFCADPDSLGRIRRRMEEDESLSFARARQLAAEECCGSDADALRQPNNILAIEYLKAIQRKALNMEPLAIARCGSDHDREGEHALRSAMQLRSMLSEGKSVDAFVPPAAFALMELERSHGRIRDEKLLERILLSRLYRLEADAFDRLPDADGGAGRRLYKSLWQGRGIEEIVRLSVGKRYTAARMRRMLLCAALGICADDTKTDPPYIRPLAMNEKGMRALREAAPQAAIPIVSRAGAVKKLGISAERVFDLTARAHALYRLQFVANDDRDPNSDWTHRAVFVENAQIRATSSDDFGQERGLKFNRI